MRGVFALLLAAALAAAPATAGALCRCGDQTAAPCCGCCEPGECRCCGGREDGASLDGACPCVRASPQAPEPAGPGLPVPAPSPPVLLPEAATAIATAPTRVPARSDPHPEVLLPLVI